MIDSRPGARISISMSTSNLKRRVFLKQSALAAAALAGPRALAATTPANPRISLQLYSVREACASDFDGTLEAVAKMGFAGVEFAGYYGYAEKGKDLRRRLDDLGLKAAATHIATAALRGDALRKTVEFHQQIGCGYLIVPHDPDFTDVEKSKALADFFNHAAEALKPHGMATGYHNHKAEFDQAGDSNHWELFASRTSKDVILQIDFGWSTVAGQNGADLIRRHPGRMQVVHFKPTVLEADRDRKRAIFGEDSVDWTSILPACREAGGTEWVTLEQEVYPDGKSPLECTALSLAGLKKIW
jgi:sugar phosphate isomerase/epimerase